ncbi:MAG TPA: histidine kinase [Ktedonobacteraceae bacterium]|nr:histidine kinase [Ktedonobacteraceae bacterium]
MSMPGPDNALEALSAASLQPTTGAHAFRLESLDSALLASVLEASLDGFLLFNSDLRCFSANRAACDLLGLPLETIRGKHIFELCAGGNHEARLLAQTDRWSSMIVRPNGERREVECMQVLIEQGGDAQYVVMMRDVTNVRQALREVTILKQLTTGITYSDSLESILAKLARDVVQMLGIPACFITLVSGSPPQFRVLSDYGLPSGFTATMKDLAQVGARLPTLYAFQENRVVLHNFPPTDAFYTRLFPQKRWSSEADALLRHFLDLRLQFSGGNIVSVPLLYNGTALGVFNAYYPLTSPPDIADLSLFTSIAELTAVTIHNARLFMAAQDRAALEERQRLARELHDSVSQQIYGITLGVQSARHFIETDPPYAVESLDYALSLSRACQADMRALLFMLHPEALESAGLVEALMRHVSALGTRHGLAVEVHFCAEPPLALDAKEALYRIAQEALYNIVKHAHARHVMLRLAEMAGKVILEIEDDGTGFNPAEAFPGHLGLRSMRERAQRLGGTLEIKSAPGGTCVHVALPA